MFKSPGVELKTINDLRQVICKGKYHDFTDVVPYVSPEKFKDGPGMGYNIVPNIIHFIWIGSVVPEKYVKNMQTYCEKNPVYIIYFWHDYDVCESDMGELWGRKNFVLKSLKKNNYDVNIRNKYIFENETNMGCKADIIRYEIVYQYGGIYADIDSVCITGFDGYFKMPLLSYTDRQRWNNVQNAFFAFPKKYIFLDYLIQCLRWSYYDVTHKKDIPSIAGPTFVTKHLYLFNDTNIKCIHQKHIIFKGAGYGTGGGRGSGGPQYTYHTMDRNWKKPRSQLVSPK